MSASTAFANDILTAIFTDGDFGSTYIALHTADPGAAGTQSTSEAAYTGYARKQVTVGTGWTVSGATFQNASAIEFDEVTGAATGTATHFTIGAAGTGASRVYLRGKLQAPVTIAVGQELRFKAGFLTGSVDTSAPV